MSESSSDDFSDIDYNDTKQTNPTQQRNPENNTGINLDSHNDYFGSDEFDAARRDQDVDENNIISHKTEITNNIQRNVESIGDKSNTNDKLNSDLYYNARDYDALNVNNEIRRLFEYIERFKYNEIELETQLKPFIPDYIPSIGNVDSFLKPTLSSIDYDKQENNEKLGIYYLDEPILNQSDPSTFYLKLTNESKQVSMNKHQKISSIVDAEKNTNKIRNWIENFKEIKHKSLSDNINIDNLNNMRSIEELMQPFINEKFNKYINNKNNKKLDIIPSHLINLSLEQYAKIMCNVLDIPVQNNDISTPLHLLFSTYAALQSTSSN